MDGIDTRNLPRNGSLRESFVWVWDSLALDEPELGSCPSLGALGMLEWAKSHPNDFYKLASGLIVKEKTDEISSLERKVETHCTKISAQCDRLLDALLGQAAEADGSESEVSEGASESGTDQPDDAG
uniref:Uncharacterized protein n=1 Tax=viral metagenome TaxID=1070528 RepID=A0A6M3KUQ7_9ZZZZ